MQQQSRSLFFILIILWTSLSKFGVCDEDDSDDGGNDCDDSSEQSKLEYIEDFVGTNLFGNDGMVKECFTMEDIALLTVRREFEFLLPKNMEKCLLDDESVHFLIQHFYVVHKIIARITDEPEREYCQKAFSDAVGGYLNSYLMPVTKYSFYAGLTALKTTELVIDLLQRCKRALNTYGTGWRHPIPYSKEFEDDIDPLNVSNICQCQRKEENACLSLSLADELSENDEDMIVSLPKLDPDEFGLLTNIWLPFKRKHFYDLQSASSAFILIRYFVAVTRCYHFQKLCPDAFNFRLKQWLEDNIEPHLNDDMLYPGLGAVLRISMTIQHVAEPIVKAKRSSIKVTRDVSAQNKSIVIVRSKKNITEQNKKCGLWSRLFGKSTKVDDETDVYDYKDDDIEEKDENRKELQRKAKRRDILMIILLIVLILLVIIFIVAMIMKYMRDLCKSNDSMNGKRKEKVEVVQVSNRKKGGLCTFLANRGDKRKGLCLGRDEEIALRSNSSSVIPDYGNARIKSGEVASSARLESNDSKNSFRSTSIEVADTDRTNEQWTCVVCQQIIPTSDPIYTQNLNCPVEERKCQNCLYSAQQVDETLPLKQPRFSLKKKAKVKSKDDNLKRSPRKSAGSCNDQTCPYSPRRKCSNKPACQTKSGDCGCCDERKSSRKRMGSGFEADGDKTNPNWVCVKCQRPIKRDDPIYFRDPRCPIEKRMCSGCHGRQKAKLNCISCARPIKENEHFQQSSEGRKCQMCVRGGFKAVNKSKPCLICKEPVKQEDRGGSKKTEKRICAGCEEKNEPLKCEICSKSIEEDDAVLSGGITKCPKCAKENKSKWKCVLCDQSIKADDPIHYKRPNCPKDKRKCADCDEKSKRKSNCVSCGKSIDETDPNNTTSLKDHKQEGKCASCRERAGTTQLKAKGRCANCQNIISENDPVYHRSETFITKNQRKCSMCCRKSDWYCVDCANPINETDPIYMTKPNCPIEERKCHSCWSLMKSPRIKPVSSIKLNNVYSARLKTAKPFSISKRGMKRFVCCSVVSLEPEYSGECSKDFGKERSKSFDAMRSLLPKDLTCLLDDDKAESLLQYFYQVNKMIYNMAEGDEKRYAEKAFYDAVGGYFNYLIIPLCKLSYYAGVITLRTTEHVFSVLDKCKRFLNTNGNGWRKPTSDFYNIDLNIQPIRAFCKHPNDTNKSEATACLTLNLTDIRSENDEEMIVSLPKLDPQEKGRLSIIWLPFKRKHSYNLKSKLSAFILVKYFVLVSRCYQYQGVCQKKFNQRLKEWIEEYIEPHLQDEILYPGLGAVLRIIETIDQGSNNILQVGVTKKRQDQAKQHVKATKSTISNHDTSKLKKSNHDSLKSIKTSLDSLKSIKWSTDSLKPKKPNHESLKSKKSLNQSANVPVSPLQVTPLRSTKKKTNFFRQLFTRKSDTSSNDVEFDEKGFDDEENFKAKRKNYIIAAVAVAVVLMIFVCVVAIITKNMCEMCKGRARLKKRKHQRKVVIQERKAGGQEGSWLFRKNRYKGTGRPPRDVEETTSPPSSSSGVKDSHMGIRRFEGTSGEKYDIDSKQSSLYLPIFKHNQPLFGESLKSIKKTTRKSSPNKYSPRGIKISPEMCKYCGQPYYPTKDYPARRVGSCMGCFGQKTNTLNESEEPNEPSNSQWRISPKYPLPLCFPPQAGTSATRSTKRVSPRIKPVHQLSPSPPKFSISKKTKKQTEDNKRVPKTPNAAAKKSPPPTTISSPINAYTPRSSEFLSSSQSPQPLIPKTKSILKNSPPKSSTVSSQKPGKPSRRPVYPKSCPNFTDKREIGVTSSWETLDSKR